MNYGACGDTGRVMENMNKDNAVEGCEYGGYRTISGDMYRVHIEIQTETNICIYVYREICGSMQREIGMHVGYMYRDSYTCKENLFLESAIYIYIYE